MEDLSTKPTEQQTAEILYFSKSINSQCRYWGTTCILLEGFSVDIHIKRSTVKSLI